MQQTIITKYPYKFFTLYALIYMSFAIYGTFAPVYLEGIGYDRSAIGTMMALGPFVSIVSQPVWGVASDRARDKNTVLRILLAGSAVAVISYLISDNFYYLLVVIGVFSFFQTAIRPISDTITLEYITETRWKFGPIRMAGTIGYAAMSILAGWLAKKSINNIFGLYFFVTMLAFVTTMGIPRIKGHQSEGNPMPLRTLFKYRDLMALMVLNLIVQSTMGFYYSFFPLFYRQMGADNSLLGWAASIAAICEIPFLVFADRILKKIGVHWALLGSTAVTALRWMFYSFTENVYVILLLQSTHGLMFIVFAFSLATYINKNVPKELKASGQTLNGLVGFGLARIIGSFLGGFLSDMVGIKHVFLYSSFLTIITMVAFIFVFREKLYIDSAVVGKTKSG